MSNSVTHFVQSYPRPVSELLALGRPAHPICWDAKKWADYVQRFDFTERHVPDLIRMATDRDLNFRHQEDPAVYAPQHAWRALGQLRAESAIEPLLAILNVFDQIWDDAGLEEIPSVLGMIGASAIHPANAFALDARNRTGPRWTACRVLTAVAEWFPACRERCLACLRDLLQRARWNPPNFNGMVTSCLVDLNDTDSAGLIKWVYHCAPVDSFICGPWPTVAEELGVPVDIEAEPPTSDTPSNSNNGQPPKRNAKRRRFRKRKTASR